MVLILADVSTDHTEHTQPGTGLALTLAYHIPAYLVTRLQLGLHAYTRQEPGHRVFPDHLAIFILCWTENQIAILLTTLGILFWNSLGAAQCFGPDI